MKYTNNTFVPPYSNPINYKGRYFYRSGATKQELKEYALNKFLLSKTGYTWDGYPVEGVHVGDLSQTAFDRFKNAAIGKQRTDEGLLTDSRENILKNLGLIDTRTGHLTKAAILLFHDTPQKYVIGAFTKIAMFKNDDDELLYYDEVKGSIMEQIEKVKDLLTTKYAYVTTNFGGFSRIEAPAFPNEAIREALLNALVHEDYSNPNPIQISVYPDHIVFCNAGLLPDEIPPTMLFEKHPSIARNPLIANTLFRCGDIDTWGRGYIKIMKSVGASKLLPPVVTQVGGTMLTLYSNIKGQLAAMGIEERLVPIVEFAARNGLVTNSNVQNICGVSKPTATRLLSKLLDFIEPVGVTGKGTYYVLKGSQRAHS